jgi:HEPN domain-containing protein
MKQHEIWLLKAENDLKSAEKLVEGEDPVLDTAIYHTQQCAEKALKAYLVFFEEPVRKIHDLDVLLSDCIIFDNSFEVLREHTVILNPYSAAFRYPGEILDPSMEDVLEAKLCAKNVLDFVSERIRGD